jgi:hypothetical protein
MDVCQGLPANCSGLVLGCALMPRARNHPATNQCAVGLCASVQVLDSAGIRDPFIRNWLDLLSFLLSGLPADGTIAAEVAFMFNE